MYLQPEAIGCIVHQANKALCEVLGDDSHKDWVVTIPDIKEVTVAGIVDIVNNPDMTSKDLFENWKKDKISRGYSFGPVKDDVAKTHPSLVDYDKLPPEQRIKDVLLLAIVKAISGFQDNSM